LHFQHQISIGFINGNQHWLTNVINQGQCQVRKPNIITSHKSIGQMTVSS